MEKQPLSDRALLVHRESSEALAYLLEAVLICMEQGVLACDGEGRFIATNSRFQALLDLPAELCMPGAHFLDFARYLAARGDYGPGEVETLAQERWQAVSTGDGLKRYSLVPTKGLVLEVATRPMTGGGFVNTYSDVTEARAIHQSLQESEARFRLLAENSGDVVALNDLDGTRRYVSPASERVLGWKPEELIGQKAIDAIHPEDIEILRESYKQLQAGVAEVTSCYRYPRPDGSWLWVEGRARLLEKADGGAPDSYVVVLRDASERKAYEYKLMDTLQRMEVMAITDGLTGLANRRCFDDIGGKEWKRCLRSHLTISVLLLDVDHFKLFNDNYGHLAGDDCLRSIAAEIEASARRPGDLAARYGGEEFALLMPATDQKGALRIAETIQQRIRDLSIPHEGNAPEGVVTASIGIATFAMEGREKGESIKTLLTAADTALYQAKMLGRNRIAVASADSNEPSS